MRIAIILLIYCISISCNNEKKSDVKTEGMDWHYGLDVYRVLNTDVIKYGNKITGFIESTRHQNGKIDTAYLSGLQVDWPKYLNAFASINMYSDKLSGQYKMIQNIDTITNLVAIQYVPLFDNAQIKDMIVTLDATTSDLRKVYAETVVKNPLSTKHQYITYIPGKFIQVVDEKSTLVKAGERTSYQLNFKLVNDGASVDIMNE